MNMIEYLACRPLDYTGNANFAHLFCIVFNAAFWCAVTAAFSFAIHAGWHAA